MWGAYNSKHPLKMILAQKFSNDMLNSFMRMHKQGGWMPQSPSVHGDKQNMNGIHCTIVFLDAWRKGIRDYDVAKRIYDLS